MSHVLEKGFFQRVFLYQNSVSIETRQTTSEHRMSGAYVPVPDRVWSYEDLADSIRQTGDIVRDRLLNAAGLTLEEYDKLGDVQKENLAIKHGHDVFQISPNFHAALLNAVDDYYALVKQVRNDSIRETAMSFLPNVENYTLIFTTLIAATMGSAKLTSDHVMMATEIIFDNLNNLFIWLEEKESYKQAKRTEGAMKQWKKAWSKCHKMVNNRANREVVRKTQITEIFAAQNGINERTARRKVDDMIQSGVVKTVKDGRLVFVYFEV